MAKTIEQKAKEATHLFNLITGASYYGTHFKSVLVENDAARKAAEELVLALQAAQVRGMR